MPAAVGGRACRGLALALATACATTAAIVGGAAAEPGKNGPRPQLFIAGPLANFDHRPLQAKRASATILATEGGPSAPGIASIEVSVGGKRVARRRIDCRPSCSPSARLAFTYRRRRFGGGRQQVRIRATDAAGATGLQTLEVDPAIGGGAGNAPEPGPAFYLTAPSATDLRRQAYDDAARFARARTSGPGLLVLDFGAARHHGALWGVRLRGGTFFSDDAIHRALEAAARGFRDHYRGGRVTIVYASSNALLGAPGHGDEPLTARTAREAGRRQALALRHLRLYPHEAVAVGGDIEPGYDLLAPPRVSIALVAGAATAPGGRPYFDVGTAPCTGSRCTNGWTLRDLCAVASGGARRAVPEIYYGEPIDQASEWAAVQRQCGIDAFAGVGASPLGDFTPAQSWQKLRGKTRAAIGRLLVVFPT